MIALGAGALEDAANRAAIAAGGTLVFLDASLATCAARTAPEAGTRPLLREPGALARLHAERRQHYLTAPLRVAVDGLSAAEVARAVDAALRAEDATLRAERVVHVATVQPYDVAIGATAIDALPERVRPQPGGRVVVVTDERVAPLAARVARAYDGAGFATTVLAVQADEALKSLESLGALYARFVEAQLDRRGLVVGVGGGTIGDAVGFAAATFQRGVRYVGVPTTLLAAVDAAIGGKTGINLAAGKNLVGTVTQPAHVAIAPHALRSLERRDVVSGYGEMLKYGLALDAALYRALRAGEAALLDDPASALDAIARCVELKAEIVAHDEQDVNGLRAVLNFGHTVGHAIEQVAGYGALRHGEAVIVGMRAALALSVARGGLDGAAQSEIDAHLAALPVPPAWRDLDASAVAAATRGDKKRHAKGTRFVLLDAVGHARLDDGVGEPELHAALAASVCDERAGRQRPEPEPAGRARARHLRPHHAARAGAQGRRARAQAAPAGALLPVQPRGRHHRRAAPAAPLGARHRDQPRRVHPLLVRDPRRARRRRAARRRSPPLGHQRARGVPPHLGRARRLRRRARRARRRLLPRGARPARGAAAMSPRRLGRDGPAIGPIALGCMGMSEFYAPVEEREAIRTIQRALELGLTLLDTSDMYGFGDNERLLSRALQGRRGAAIVATKGGILRRRDEPTYRGVDGRPEYIRAACNASLRRLGIDAIDLYYLHRVDPDVPIEETVGALAELVTAGKVRHIGLSEAAPETLRRAAATAPIAALESEFSLFTRDVETNGVLATARELGITFVAYAPLGRGVLTGALRSAETLAPDDLRRKIPRFDSANLATNLTLVDALGAIATELHCTTAQLALAWLLNRGDDVVALPGCQRVEHIEENAAAADLALDPATLARIDALLPPGAAAGARLRDLRFVHR